MKITNDFFAERGRWLLIVACFFLPLSALADQVKVTDSNGNELTYSFEADGPATFIGVSKYSDDADKAGHIIIADRVTDANGAEHDVLYIGGSLSNRSKIVSVVFGQNIIATGGADGSRNDAFYNCSNLKSVTLNSKLQILGRCTFQACHQLASINLSEATSLTTIMYKAFDSADLIRSIEVPASVVTIGESAFTSIDSLRSISIPSSVQEIGSYILSYCNALESITIDAPLVPERFHTNNSNLKTLNIGAHVKRIGNSAFYGSYYLRNLTIDSGVSDLVIGEYAFAENDRLDNVTLPKGVVALEKAAFRSCDSMYVFKFADGSPITKIPQECFYYATCLQKLTLPDAVETVESGAFGQCHSLEEITFGKSLTALPNDWYLFYSCNNLKKMILPGANYPFVSDLWTPEQLVYYVHADLVDTYQSNSFTNNRRVMAIGQPTEFTVTMSEGGQLQEKVEAIGSPNNLQTLTVTGPINGTDIDYIHSSMPNIEVLNLTNASIVEGGDSYHQWNVNSAGVATIESYYGPWNTEKDVVTRSMFYNMPTLRSLSLPRDVTKIGDWAVGADRNRTYKLTHIDIPDGVTQIGRNAFEYTGIEEVIIPAGVTRLEEYTFANCQYLKKAVLPDGITFIGNSCFSECHELKDVNIPTQIETIAEYAFYNNKVRENPIVFPSTLKSIGYCAFMYNSQVKRITFSEGLETIGSSAFSNCNAVESITLPQSLTSLGNNALEGCDSITTFTFPANIKEVPDAILYHCDKLQKVVLAEGTTRLGHDAFNRCTQLNDINISTMNTLTSTGRYVFAYTGFTTMTLPNSITSMDYSAFRECQLLESINVPNQLTIVPYDFTYYCPKLKTVKMHDGIRVVGHYAFEGCKELESIALNDEITTIEYNAFSGCENLVIEKLPSALTHIGEYAFYNNKKMTGKLTIPAGVTTINYDAFRECGMTGVELPESVTKWGTGIFIGCNQLTDVKLPKNIKRIESNMFQNCSALEQILIPDSVKEIGYYAFEGAGITSIQLPDSLEVIESYAFYSTQLREFRVPDGLHGDPGSYTWGNCKRLKTIYLGRNQDYTRLESFTCLSGCDSLQLLRIYAGTPPRCDSWYMGYRSKCVLEVPEDAVQLYKEANVWKEFKEIRGFFQGDVLNDLDFAVLKKLYNDLDGEHWQKPWDLSNNHRSMGKWYGVMTVGDYITAIDLSKQGLKGELPDSLFMLSRLETLNLSDNQIKADLTTLLAKRSENATLTEVNMMGNQLTGDIYPFASKLPNLTKLDLSYNQLTAVSQPISREKLDNRSFSRGFQFIDYQTKQVVEGAPVVDITAGVPTAIEFNTLQTYRHEYGDYNYDCRQFYRHYLNRSNDWVTSDWELIRNDDKLWTLFSDGGNYPLQAPKGVPQMFTSGDPWWSHLSFILRLDWQDGDANADQTVDVTDLQSVIYYALNDRKVNGQMFNFTTADANSDDKINVSDIVGSVDYVLNYIPTNSVQVPYYNRAPASQQNVLTIDGNHVVLTHPDAVAALQLTITGAAMGQLHVSEALKSHFSVAMREVAGGVRMVVWSAEGRMLTPGIHQLLTDLPAGAAVSEVRLADGEARHLDVVNEGAVTGIRTVQSGQLIDSDTPVYDLSGRRLGAWDTLPEGVYVIRVNGKQYKVKK